MLGQILSLQPPGFLQGVQSQPSIQTSTSSFGQYLKSALSNVEDLQVASNQSIELAGAGQGPDVHTVMIQAEKAKLALDLTVQIRNKAVEAYQEIMRMQM